MAKLDQTPIRLTDNDKTSVRLQFGALCYRFEGDKLRLLLITSRTNRRWIVPKGWPMDGLTPAQAALAEAAEEAGVTGTVSGHCAGSYSIVKQLADGSPVPCVVVLYPVAVASLDDDYRERSERRRKWFGRKKAASMVDSPELRRILLDFDPRR